MAWYEWVTMELAEHTMTEFREYGIPVPGDLVRARYDLFVGEGSKVHEGALGIVREFGRGKESDQNFKDREALAVTENRKLGPEDYEVLVDAEGPVVEWPNQATSWYPGQSMGCLQKADAPGAGDLLTRVHQTEAEMVARVKSEVSQ